MAVTRGPQDHEGMFAEWPAEVPDALGPLAQPIAILGPEDDVAVVDEGVLDEKRE